MATLTTDDAPAPHLLGVAKGGAKDRVLGGGASKMPGLPASMGGAECSLDGREGNTALQTEDGLREAEEGLAVFRGTAEVADGDAAAAGPGGGAQRAAPAARAVGWTDSGYRRTLQPDTHQITLAVAHDGEREGVEVPRHVRLRARAP